MSGWLTRKRLFAFHGWLGLTLGLPLFIICLSGSFAVMAPEIDRLISPEMRVPPPSNAEAKPLPWQRLVEAVEKDSPGGEVAFIEAPGEREEAWTATVAYSAKDQRVVYFDPFTGKVQGHATSFNAQSFFRIFHKQLYILEGPAWPHGRVIVCVFSIVLLLSALTGLMFFKGWWRALFRLRLGSGKRAFWSDFHRFAGVWTFLFAMLFALSGIWYLTVRLMEDFGIAEHDPMPEIPAEVSAARPPLLPRLSLDELAARAHAAFPGFQIRAVATGIQHHSAVRFYGETSALLSRTTDNEVHLDPYTGEILSIEKVSAMSPARRLDVASYPLHFGRFGGYATKIIWTIAGLAISGGIFAGSVIWWLRSRREDPGFFRRKRIWAIASLLLNLAIIGLATVSTIGFIRAQITGATNTQPRHSLGVSDSLPWQVEALRHSPDATSQAAYSFRFEPGSDPNYRAAYAWFGDALRPADLKPLSGTRLQLFLPGQHPPARLNLEIESWDGTLHRASYSPQQSSAPPITPPPAPVVPAILWTVVGGFLVILLLPVAFWLARIR
jgi:uncharacterized iron-regulated membrane protein